MINLIPPLFQDLLKSQIYIYTLFIAVISGFLQGLVWTIMSFIGIVWHLAQSQNRKIVYGSDSYNTLLETYLYYSFIKKDATDTILSIQPTEFFVILIFYFILNVIWMIASIFIYLESRRNFDRKRRALIIFNLWLASAILILLLDFFVCLILGLDYNKMLDTYDRETSIVAKLAYSCMATTYGIMMVLAAKGFVLWVINLIVTAIMIKVFFLFKNDTLTNEDPDEFASIENLRYSTVHVSHLPEEVRNRNVINEIRLRRRTEPVLSRQPDVMSSSSSFAPFRANINYAFDPHVENRLAKYDVTPKTTLSTRTFS